MFHSIIVQSDDVEILEDHDEKLDGLDELDVKSLEKGICID